MEFKWIVGDDLEVLDVVLESKELPSLNPEVCRALGAYDVDTLAGFIIVQVFPHLEPLWVDKKYRGTDIAAELVDNAIGYLRENSVRGFISIADSPIVAKMCEERGMVKIESPVYLMK